MPVDVQTALQRWQQGAQQGQQRYVEGVQSTSKDPIAAAIRAQPALLSNFAQAVNSGYWARQLQATGKQGWIDASVAKAGNYTTGITAGGPKYERAMGVWLPRIYSASAQVNQMPSGTLAASIARMTAFSTALYNAKRGL
jgi:hypothetical protein